MGAIVRRFYGKAKEHHIYTLTYTHTPPIYQKTRRSYLFFRRACKLIWKYCLLNWHTEWLENWINAGCFMHICAAHGFVDEMSSCSAKRTHTPTLFFHTKMGSSQFYSQCVCVFSIYQKKKKNVKRKEKKQTEIRTISPYIHSRLHLFWTWYTFECKPPGFNTNKLDAALVKSILNLTPMEYRERERYIESKNERKNHELLCRICFIHSGHLFWK